MILEENIYIMLYLLLALPDMALQCHSRKVLGQVCKLSSTFVQNFIKIEM